MTMTGRLSWTIATTLAIAVVWASAQTPPGGVDVASAAMGGRIESVTSGIADDAWAAINLIARTPLPGWHAGDPTLPQEIVFSFHARQPVLVGTVVINPVTEEGVATAKDVEIWTSTESPTTGFERVATSSLKNAKVDQPITFTPVEAKFLKLSILSTYPFLVNGQPEPAPAGLRSVRILEAQRSGYMPLLARNPDLAALAKGVIPSAPSSALTPLPATGLTSCLAPPPEVKATTPAHAESKNVLVIARDPNDYTPTRFKPDAEAGAPVKPVDYSIYGRITFTHVTPRAATPAHLLSAAQIDTVAISQLCDIDKSVSPAFKKALMAWVAAGHKLIIHDSDTCGGTTDLTSPNRPPDYSWLPFRMKTVNPGKAGLRGTAVLLEDNTIASRLSTDPAYLPLSAWMNDEEGNGNELGDSNVITEHDPHWCGVMYGTNGLKKSGFMEAYARFGRGLIIYNGLDLEHIGSPAYNQLVTRELAQPFDPDNLTCSRPLGDFLIATDNDVKPAKAGATYTYPLQVLPNFGWTGRVTLSAAYRPADPSISVKLDQTTVDVEAVAAKVALVVTTTGAAPPTSGIVEVRGRDAAGKSNVLCLALTEPTPDSSSILTEGKWVTRGILFDVNSDRIKPESYGPLKEIANVLAENKDLKVLIVGHTDADGDEAANLDLSKRRAASVKVALTRDFGIDAARMETDGKGESQPVDTNDTPAGKANNRRVEFIKK